MRSPGPTRGPSDSAGRSEATGGSMTDKRTTLDEAVASIESGMTIGIGGWGSRRKPMAFVRALLRTDATDLTVVTYGGPDIGLLCAAGKVKRVYYGFVSLDSAAVLRPVVRQGAHQRLDRGPRDGRRHAAMRLAGCGATASVPAHPRRLGQRRARVLGRRAQDREVPVPHRRRLRGAHRDARAEPRRGVRAHECRRRAGQCGLHRHRPVLRRPVPDGGASSDSSRSNGWCRRKSW